MEYLYIIIALIIISVCLWLRKNKLGSLGSLGKRIIDMLKFKGDPSYFDKYKNKKK